MGSTTKELNQTTSYQDKLIVELKQLGAEIIRFVDIFHLPDELSKGYPHAILLGIPLSKEYLKKVDDTPDYVRKMIREKTIQQDEFYLKELKTDGIADEIAANIQKSGYLAYSQSEKNVEQTGYYNAETRSTPLPHKTIAGMAGLGWIGKHNLLVTPVYGSAICMCTVLTDAPLETQNHKPLEPGCGSCHACQAVCEVSALKGKTWSLSTVRDEIVDVFKCTTCFKCVVACPHTQKYMRSTDVR